MTTNIKLTDSQRNTLEHAAQNPDGKIDWFPGNIKGGARKKVIDSMFARALITPLGENWVIAAEGYDALGLPRPSAGALLDPGIEVSKPRSRDNSKQAQVIGLLKRPEGATIVQICEATSWQAHTVRGAFAGSFKKKLGLVITSTKDQGGARVYRIAGGLT